MKMKALVFDKKLRLIECDRPNPKPAEALVSVSLAGICNTDIELTRGYKDFSGILGHEAVGTVVEVNGCNQSLVGKRVVPEINFGCGDCNLCKMGLTSHCTNRRTLGINNIDGCFAQYYVAPANVLHIVPDSVPDEQAVFVEPLAAALEVLEQLHVRATNNVLVLGDGKLGITIALALNAMNIDVVLVGQHENKLEIAKKHGVKATMVENIKLTRDWDVVVEATGSASGFETALALVKPRGALVLKSTVASGKELNLSPIVINEITVIGSRCGPFQPALRLLENKKIDFAPMISATYPFDNVLEAFEKSREKGMLKILVRM